MAGHHSAATSPCAFTLWTLIRCNVRRRGRELFPAAIMLAIGLFMAVGLGAQKITPKNPTIFAEYVETAIPITNFSDISAPLPMLAITVAGGATADCFNLNRVDLPRILGVPPAISDGNFPLEVGIEPTTSWDDLFVPPTLTANGDNVIPAFADAATLQWGLQLPLGAELTYSGVGGSDDNAAVQRGDNYRLRFIGALAPSVFQGAVLISEENFTRLYPHTSPSIFLLETMSPATRQKLAELFKDYGASGESIDERLNKFNTITNSYLLIFQQLCRWGVALGIIGMALILRRIFYVRRAEITLLKNLGFSRTQIWTLQIGENLPYLLGGALAGIIAGAMW